MRIPFKQSWCRLGVAVCLLAFAGNVRSLQAADADKPFVHPGGLHTQQDLDRMRSHVAAGDHPWIESWKALIQDPKAQLTYKPAPGANMGKSRQRASADAVAAYLNALRGYISGDTAYTDHAIQICNEWSAAVNQSPTGTDQPGLNGIFTYEFAVVGELLRVQVGTRWKQEDFARFQHMMREYLYPTCHDFLIHHDGTCLTHFWANWDACNITAVGSIGVLCDDHALFDEAVEYFKHGDGNGSIKNAVYFIHPDGLGQWQETGRDQEHAELGIGLLATFCEIAGHQGVDLFGYDNNRLLAGAEYAAAYTLWKPVAYKFYNNCDEVNQYWPSRSERGRLQRPIWEMLYNEYVVKRGVNAPNVTQIAALNRPEGFTHDDHFGYGTLCYTLNASAYPPLPVPSAPKDLTASAGVGRVHLRWTPPVNSNGFTIRRAAQAGGPYTELTHFRGIFPEYDDNSAANGTAYYYVVAADNQAGTGVDSAEVHATPATAAAALPKGWTHHDVGAPSKPGSAEFAAVEDGTFIVHAAGSNIGGKTDGIGFANTMVKGDAVLTARLINLQLRGAGKWSRVGIMMRKSLEPDAPAVAMVLGDAGYREAHFTTRARSGDQTSQVSGNGYTGTGQFPTWFRIERKGNTFTAYQSDNGEQWYKVGSSTVTMGDACFAGIAVASGSAESISMTCDHVSVTPAP